jgi:hypothetical protein
VFAHDLLDEIETKTLENFRSVLDRLAERDDVFLVLYNFDRLFSYSEGLATGKSSRQPAWKGSSRPLKYDLFLYHLQISSS